MSSSMWPTTPLTKRIGMQLPIIQAPMAGGATTPELIAAVSNAACLGSLGAGYLSPEEIRSAIAKIRHLTDQPFAVNLFVPQEHHASLDKIISMGKLIEDACLELNIPVISTISNYMPAFDDQMKIIIEERVPVFSFTFGIPDKVWIKKLKDIGTILIGTATSLAEAIQLEKHGIDFIVAQGSEAGGHRGTFIRKEEDSLLTTSNLLQQLVNNITIPVLASGGIMDAQGIVAAMHSGASGVQMGTAFLSCYESGINKKYKQALLNTTEDNTVLTRVFSGKLARGINNKFISRMEPHASEILDYPVQNALTRQMRNEADKQSCIDFMSMWAGQNYYLCREQSAADLIQKLNDSVDKLLA